MRFDGIPIKCYNSGMTTKRIDLAASIRRAMKRDGRTVYAFARDTGLPVSGVQRFAKGGGMNLDSASRLCEVLGLDLLPTDGGKGR